MYVRSRSLLVIAIATSLACAQDAEWIQDFAAAKAKAAAENKDLLIDFTGSDWCVWCQRLDGEVFAQDEFKAGIAKDFILVKLDFPNDKSLVTDEIRAQNEKLQAAWMPQGFPSVYLADAAGRPYAQTGYRPDGAGKYLEHVAELRKAKASRDENLTKAKDAKGADRAKLLAAGVKSVVQDGETAPVFAEDMAFLHYRAEIDEIIALDVKNEAGLKAEFEALIDSIGQKQVLNELQGKFNELAQGGDWDGADKVLDESLAKHKGRKLIEQMATFFKAIVCIESKKDFDGALKLMDAAIALAPDSEAGKNLPRIKANIEKMRDQAGGGDQKKEGGEKKEGGGK